MWIFNVVEQERLPLFQSNGFKKKEKTHHSLETVETDHQNISYIRRYEHTSISFILMKEA